MKTLKQFYRELQAWIDDGCPEHEVFKTYLPICHAASRWSSDGRLLNEVANSFVDAGLGWRIPFNENHADLRMEAAGNKIYQNPARLAWIKEHAS